MIRHPLTAEDAAERTQFIVFSLRFGVPAFILFSIAELTAAGKGWIPLWVATLLLVVNLPVILALSTVMFSMIEGTAKALTGTVYGAGNLPPEPAHSGLESLVARGLYPQAAEAFTRFLTEHPGDSQARIKLGNLYREHLNQPEAAERLYLEVRQHGADPRHRFLAWNLLIELYRAMGRKDRLLVEVARFADHYRETRAGREAAKLLRELKEERHGEQG